MFHRCARHEDSHIILIVEPERLQMTPPGEHRCLDPSLLQIDPDHIGLKLGRHFQEQIRIPHHFLMDRIIAEALSVLPRHTVAAYGLFADHAARDGPLARVVFA